MYKKWKINSQDDKMTKNKEREWRKPEKFFVWFRDQFFVDYIITTSTIPSARTQLIESYGLGLVNMPQSASFSKTIKRSICSIKAKCKYFTMLDVCLIPIPIHLNEVRSRKKSKREKCYKNSIQSIYLNEETREEKKHIMQINCSKTRLATFDHKWQYQPINRYTINTNAKMWKELRGKKTKRFVLDGFFFT